MLKRIGGYGSWQAQLVNYSTGFVVATSDWGTTFPSASYHIATFTFDQVTSDLIVAADYNDGTSWHLCVWRTRPDEALELDPNSPKSIMPGGATAGWGWQGDIVVAGDGTVYAEDGDNWPDPAKIWKVTAANGGSYEAIEMPASSHEWPGYGVWYLACDCQGEAYAVNPCLLDDYCSSDISIIRLSDLQPICVLDDYGVVDVDGFTNDAFANFYIFEDTVIGGVYKREIRRILPGELPSGFYGYDAPLSPSINDSTLEKGESDTVPFPSDYDWGNLKRVPEVPPLPSAEELSKTNLKETRDTKRADAMRAVAASMKKTDAVSCPLPKEGKLVIKVFPDPDDPSSAFWIDPTANTSAIINVLFGQSPKIEAYWKPGDDITQSTLENSEWKASNEIAPNASSNGLFKDRPEVLFNNNAGLVKGDHIQFQTVHSGFFKLTIKSTVKEHKSLPESHVEAGIYINIPEHLHDLPGPSCPYDEKIITYADKYGIPPQYIKSQVYVETFYKFKKKTFRYEPLSWDKRYASKWSNSEWTNRGYAPFRFPKGPKLSNEDFNQRDKFTHITKIDFTIQPPLRPYTCDPYERTESNVYLRSIFIAHDGWEIGSYPWNIYNTNGIDNIKGPCDNNRMNWSLKHRAAISWHFARFYCGSTATSACSRGQATLISWMLKNPTYIAQTAVCSSYGLMQIIYDKAVTTGHWRRNQSPDKRDPADLFDPDENLNLGVGFDRTNIKKFVFNGNNSKQFASMTDYQQALIKGFKKYNPYDEKYKTGYIINNAYHFMPY